MKLHLALLAGLLTMAATSVWVDGPGGAGPGPESMRGSGGLGVQLLLTADENQFRQAWNQPAPPRLRVTNTVRQGAPVSALLIFTGCVANADGVCDLVSEFMLEGPDGSKTPAGGGAVWQAKPMMPGRSQLGTISITMSFDQTDPVGDYRISADVNDQVSGNVVSVRTGLKVTQ